LRTGPKVKVLLRKPGTPDERPLVSLAGLPDSQLVPIGITLENGTYIPWGVKRTPAELLG